nr:MAG TPA: SurA N-terminal domain [Caudoviricetes sp.]
MSNSKLMKKVRNKIRDGIVAILAILSACLLFSGCNNSSTSKEREPIGYAIVNGERYDITRYAINHGLPYIWTTDGTQIIGTGIMVFIPEN